MIARVVDLGRMEYAACTEYQREVLDAVAHGQQPNTLLFVEHEPVLTLGANFHPENLLLPVAEYAPRGIDVQPTDRGGDVTYHGPNQLVIYPIFNLNDFGRDLHKWLRDLEETVLRILLEYGLDGYRFPPHTGVWVKGAKVAAIGIKVRRWVSMHGIALNCNNDLAPFGLIVPCGIEGYDVTSISRELGKDVSVEQVKPVATRAFQDVFGLRFAA